MIDLSIIIVSYNVRDYLKACLESLYEYTKDLNFEVIVVDNASTDNSADVVEQLFPQVHLFRHPNLGFGTANNYGAKLAKGKYLLFFNPDTQVFNNAIKLSFDQATVLPNLGALTCRLLYADKTIQPSGGYFPNLLRLWAWQLWIDELPLLDRLIKPVHPPASFYQQTFQPDWIMGAFMLLPKAAFAQIGGFDEKIFMYGEELELCYRLRRAGYSIHYSAHPSILHLQGKSSSSAYALINEVNGLKYFFRKHYPKWQQPWINLAFKVGALLRLLLFGIILQDAAKKIAYREILGA